MPVCRSTGSLKIEKGIGWVWSYGHWAFAGVLGEGLDSKPLVWSLGEPGNNPHVPVVSQAQSICKSTDQRTQAEEPASRVFLSPACVEVSVTSRPRL